MNAERDSVALNDQALDNVSACFNLYDAFCNIGEETEETFMKGGELGIYAGPPGVLAGAFGGAFYCALDAVKSEAASAAGEAINALRKR
jgi:hypothetical protein